MAFNFNEKILEPKEDSVLIVDSLNLAFRWKHQGRSDFRYEYERTVESLAKSYGATKVIITSDWGSSSYRKELCPEYKQNRKDKFADQSQEEKIAFEEFFEEYEATLNLLAEKGWTVLRYKGVEADDIAAHLVKHSKKYELENVWLISSDRDWDLLINDAVSRFSYVTRKEVTLDNWSEHYNVSPEEYISLKCLTGDKGDNVPGIPGIGPKRAQELIQQYGNAFSIFDATPIESKYKYIQTLNENADQILINYELMDLIAYCDEAIGENNISDIGCRINEYKH